MSFTKLITIALCFNDEQEARRLTERLRDIDPFINFIISVNFDQILQMVGYETEIDCFIIEEYYDEYPAEELIKILKRSKRYQNTAFALFSPDLDFLNVKFNPLKIHYKFDLSTEVLDVVTNIKKVISKNITPVIPKNFNILVLDNNNDFLELMTLHLNELGHHKIHLCESIKEAQIRLTHNEYDLLLLDWNLDDGTCLDLIEFIQKAPISPRTKAAVKMVITGRNSVEDLMTLVDHGVKDYLIKPFEFHELENKLDYAIEKGTGGRKIWP
ncbi:MAG: response regulator [Bdellovibrionales bacterium]|nr:response regulator [Bdellovibrionales bacterium]